MKTSPDEGSGRHMALVLGASLVIILGVGAAAAQTGTKTPSIADGWEALRGQTALDVQLLIDDDLKPVVPEASIEAAALGQLRRAGITATRWVARETVRPALMIGIEVAPIPSHFAYNVSVEYYALLQMPGMPPGRLIKGCVYRTGFDGITPVRNSASTITGTVNRSIEAFLTNAYFKANPSAQPPSRTPSQAQMVLDAREAMQGYAAGPREVALVVTVDNDIPISSVDEGLRQVILSYLEANKTTPRPGPEADSLVCTDPDIGFMPMPQNVVDEILKLGSGTARDVVYDIGWGDGALANAAAKGGTRSAAYPLCPLGFTVATRNAANSGVTGRMTLGTDFYAADLSDATVVVLHMLPMLNQKLLSKLTRELRPGERIISVVFDMGDGHPPDRTITLDGSLPLFSGLHSWTVPLKSKCSPAPLVEHAAPANFIENR